MRHSCYEHASRGGGGDACIDGDWRWCARPAEWHTAAPQSKPPGAREVDTLRSRVLQLRGSSTPVRSRCDTACRE